MQRTYRKSTVKLEKIKGYNAFTFITATWKIGLAIDNCKEDRKGKILNASQMQRVVHLASYFLQFEFFFKSHLSFTFDFIF